MVGLQKMTGIELLLAASNKNANEASFVLLSSHQFRFWRSLHLDDSNRFEHRQQLKLYFSLKMNFHFIHSYTPELSI